MSSFTTIKKFEKHHAALLIFLLVSGVFFINIFAFTAAYSRVQELQPSFSSSPIIIFSESEEPEQNQEPEPARFLDGLGPLITEVIENEGVSAAIYIQDIDTGETLGLNEKTTFVSASLYKLFASYEIARQIDSGILEPTSATGFDAGSITIEECLSRTLSYSDNTCGRALRKVIEADDAPLASINDAGFVGTSLVNDYPTTSAADVGLFFERIYKATEFDSSVNDMLLKPLLAQQINNRLPAPLPDGTPIAHKTADLDGYSHDGGIFYTPEGTYILIVLTGPWANGYSEAPPTHIAISSLVYDWFNPSANASSF